jgi:hypothetical protein
MASDGVGSHLSPTRTAASQRGASYLGLHLQSPPLPQQQLGDVASGASEIANPVLMDFIQLSSSRLGIAADRGQSQMLAQQDSIPAVSVAEAVISPALFDGSAAVNPMAADGIHQDLEWRSLDLPLDIQDLLSGFSTY